MPMLIATLFIKVKKLEATQCPSMHELDKQNEVYPFNGLLFSLKKEENSAICHKDESERHDTKQNKSDTKRNTVF